MPGRLPRTLTLALLALSLTLPNLLSSGTPLVDEGPFLAWHTETIDDGSASFDNALALDSHGVPHILYSRQHPTIGGVGPHYATIVNGAWTTTVLGPIGGNADIKVDAQDNVHAAYITDWDDIHYSKKEGGVWTHEYAAPAAFNARLALNPLTGEPHIAYGHGLNGATHAYRTTNGWVTETIHYSGTYTAYDIDFTIDTTGTLHVAFNAGEDEDPTLTNLHYATKTNGQWTDQLIDTDCGAAGITIDTDTQNHPHIACHDYTQGLRYLTWNGATWTSELIDNSDDLIWDRPPQRAGFEPSLQLDSNDTPHISYSYLGVGSLTNPGAWGHLHYATKTSTGWHKEPIDASGVDTGRHSSLTLDAKDRPHVAYTFITRTNLNCIDPVVNACFDLKYATPAAALPEALAARALTTLP